MTVRDFCFACRDDITVTLYIRNNSGMFRCVAEKADPRALRESIYREKGIDWINVPDKGTVIIYI